MSVDAVTGVQPVAPLSGDVDAAPARPPAGAPAEPFSAVLQKHLDAPRRDIASVRSEIAAIRAGAPFLGQGAAGGIVGGASRAPDLLAAETRAFSQMPGWLDAQLARQATGDTADPYGWRQMSRTIADQVIGPGYGTLFERQMDQESGFLPDVVYGLRVSSAGAEGIAQLMPQYYANVDRLDPRAGLMAGAQTMRHYLGVWDGDVRRAMASYNAGLGRVQQLVDAHGANWEAALPHETRQYLEGILGPAEPRFTGLVAQSGAVFGGRGPGGVLTSPLAAVTAQRATGSAVDFFGAAGASVLAPADGVVLESTAGRLVLDNGNGWQTTLVGLLSAATPGATLLRGQTVGTLGGGGLLRLGVTREGLAVDTSRYLLATV